MAVIHMHLAPVPSPGILSFHQKSSCHGIFYIGTFQPGFPNTGTTLRGLLFVVGGVLVVFTDRTRALASVQQLRLSIPSEIPNKKEQDQQQH